MNVFKLCSAEIKIFCDEQVSIIAEDALVINTHGIDCTETEWRLYASLY